MNLQSAILDREPITGDYLLMAARPLDDYREDLYMTVVQFAKHLDIAPHTYYKIIRGERPTPTTMRRIADRLGVHPSEIAEFARKPTNEDDRKIVEEN